MEGVVIMKKHHIINQSTTGKCFCGLTINNQLIAIQDNDNWYDHLAYLIDHTNYKDVLCINCMKQFDIDLINQFETKAFLIDYSNRLPKTGRAMKFFKSQMKRKRQSIDRSKPKAKPTNQSKAKKSKPANQSPIKKSDKGKARQARKKANQSKAESNQPTNDKCKVIAKPNNQLPNKPKDDIIELKESDRIDKKTNQSKAKFKEVIVDCDPDPNWSIGMPIKDDSIVELAIGEDWKLIRNDKKLNQWKFVNLQVIKGIPKWIDDSEFIDYKEASQLIIDGYCE
jgi:hypothetical protein